MNICKDCFYWTNVKLKIGRCLGVESGHCAKINGSVQYVSLLSIDVEHLFTLENFGCILWENGTEKRFNEELYI